MHARHRSRFRGRNLPSTFAQEMASYGASDAWDFTTQTYIRGGVLAPSGLTFTRASVGSYLNSNNTMTVFGSGQPRIGDRGLLIEGSRQNLFLNSAVGETQSITVTAAAHTLSFYGTGTVTLSGVSTDGPLVGTGEFDRVSLTFTPTAGSLTLTVSGDIKWVNLELGSFPSSWIPTEGTAVTRAADVATAVPTAGTDYPLTLFAEFERLNAGQSEVFLNISDGTANNRAQLLLTTNDAFGGFVASSGSTQMDATVSGTVTPNVATKTAFRVNTNAGMLVRSGTLGTQDTSLTLPNTPTVARFGANQGGAAQSFVWLRNISLILSALPDNKLQEITT